MLQSCDLRLSVRRTREQTALRSYQTDVCIYLASTFPFLRTESTQPSVPSAQNLSQQIVTAVENVNKSQPAESENRNVDHAIAQFIIVIN